MDMAPDDLGPDSRSMAEASGAVQAWQDVQFTSALPEEAGSLCITVLISGLRPHSWLPQCCAFPRKSWRVQLQSWIIVFCIGKNWRSHDRFESCPNKATVKCQLTTSVCWSVPGLSLADRQADDLTLDSRHQPGTHVLDAADGRTALRHCSALLCRPRYHS